MSPTKDAALQNLQLEDVRKAANNPGKQNRDLIDLRYGRELTVGEISKVYCISTVAAPSDCSWCLCRLETVPTRITRKFVCSLWDE